MILIIQLLVLKHFYFTRHTKNMAINQQITFIVKSSFLNIYAIWLREFKVYLRERSRLVASLFTPLLWLFIVGSGLGSTTTLSVDVNYQQFIFPGIISMSIIFTSVFYGAYIIWDRKFDFLKSVMVAPISREIIFIGKTLGGMSNSIITDNICFSNTVFFTYCIGFRTWKSYV